MIYIYRRHFSEGARDLADALNDANIPARYTQGGLIRDSDRIQGRLRDGRDHLICWGEQSPWPAQRVLNNGVIRSKYQDALRLREQGVPTIQVSQNRPAVRPAGRPLFDLRGPRQLTEADGRAMIQELQNWLNQPLPPAEEWLPRRNNHIGGNDLLNPGHADYWAKKEAITREYRLHMFRGKSIRAGQKIRRDFRPDGRTPSHEWIRSFDAGWIIAYENFKSNQQQREICANAVQALELEFGAVDLAQRGDGSLFVLEVNRAPGIEGGSLEAYVQAIGKWVRGEE